MVCEEKWWSNPCDSKGDIRYDPDVSADIISIDPLYSKFQGLWVGDAIVRDADYNPRQPSPAISGVNRTYANPYPRDTRALFNITISGTRWEQHDIYIQRPNDDPIFCSIPLNPPAMNVGDDGVCGLNGYVYRGDVLKSSTFEKTKVLKGVGGTGSYQSGPNFTAETTVVGQYSAIELFTLDYMPFQASYTYTFDASYNKLIVEFTQYDLSDDDVKVSGRNIAKMTRVDDAASWIKYFEDNTASYNVTEATKNTVHLPVNGQCLVNDDGCPNTTTWCAAGDAHPDCGSTPYNEDTTVNAGVIAGLVVAIAFALIVIIAATLRRMYKKKVEEQKKKLKNQFARRIAASVDISSAEEALSMDALMKEFQRIDADGSGEISKEELRDFIMDKKAGSVSEADFNALFTALDVDDSGTVDFIEFCAFLGGCADELDAAAALSKEQKMERVSKAVIRQEEK